MKKECEFITKYSVKLNFITLVIELVKQINCSNVIEIFTSCIINMCYNDNIIIMIIHYKNNVTLTFIFIHM